MKKIIRNAALALTIAALATISTFQAVELNKIQINRSEKIDWSEIGMHKYSPTHKQIVYRYALEFCESKGDNEAINSEDRDGTASFYAFQWKPETFKTYALRYKLLPEGLEIQDYQNWANDYDLEAEILNRMLNDKKVKWDQEFPDCVSNKIGYPPKG